MHRVLKLWRGGDNLTLDDRKQKILTAVVETHVKTGEPVGSNFLVKSLGMKVSAATIRNEMAELERLGLLEQPHTSAGRVPTNAGYREYVNNLMKLKPVTEEEQKYIYGNLSERADDPEHLLEEASRLLADITNFTAVSRTPNDKEATVRHVQFVITGRCSAMVIMMASSGIIKNKNFKTDYRVTPEMIRIYHGVFNENFGGIPLTSITPALIRKVANSLEEISEYLSSPLIAFMGVCRDALHTDMKFSGQTNLLYIPDFELESAKMVLDFINHRDRIASLMNTVDEDVTILIGNENENPELFNSTVVIAKYDMGKKNDTGAIALIGPTRMDYAKSIGSLKYLADTVGDILREMLASDED